MVDFRTEITTLIKETKRSALEQAEDVTKEHFIKLKEKLDKTNKTITEFQEVVDGIKELAVKTKDELAKEFNNLKEA